MLSSEEKYRKGIISKDERRLDMLREEYKEKSKKVDPFYLNSTLPAAVELKEIRDEIKKLEEKIKEEKNRQYEENRNRRNKEYSSEVDEVILSSKELYNKELSNSELYDKNVNSYMKTNFWEKAKNLFAGKKRKSVNTTENKEVDNKLTDSEIIEKYGNQVVDGKLLVEIKELKKKYEDGIISKENYRIEEEKIIKKYRDLLKEVKENVDDFGIEHFEGRMRK